MVIHDSMPRKLSGNQACGLVLCPAVHSLSTGIKCQHCIFLQAFTIDNVRAAAEREREDTSPVLEGGPELDMMTHSLDLRDNPGHPDNRTDTYVDIDWKDCKTSVLHVHRMRFPQLLECTSDVSPGGY